MQHSFDLHVHSWYSYDAHLAPEEIFSAAREKGVGTICVCDHHNMDGFTEIKKASGRFPDVTWVPGMEVSAQTRLGGFDFVAAGLPLDAPERLADVVDEYREWMRAYNRALLEGFRVLGVPFGDKEKDEVLRTWRPGPAREMQGEVRIPNNGLKPWLTERGLIGEPGEFGPLVEKAFSEAGDKPPLPDAEDVLPRFRDCGAVIIIAHPNRLLEGEGEEKLEALLKETGVEGLEAGHNSHTPERAARYLDFAEVRGLYVSGGTDVHFRRDLDNLGRHLCPDTAAAPLLKRLTG